MLEPLDSQSPRGELISLSQKERRYLFKVIVIGEPSCGKTSLVKRYVHNMFSSHYKSTIGVDFALKEVKWDDRTEICLQFWDIAGQERFGTQTNVYFRNARGAIILADINEEETMENAKKWRNLVAEKTRLDDGSHYDPPCIFLGNKKDLIPKEKHADAQERVQKLAESMNCIGGFAVSIKSNTGIDNAIKILILKMIEEDRQEKIAQDQPKDEKISLASDEILDGPKAGCWC